MVIGDSIMTPLKNSIRYYSRGSIWRLVDVKLNEKCFHCFTNAGSIKIGINRYLFNISTINHGIR